MLDLFNLDRPLSPALARAGVAALGALLAVLAALTLLAALGNLFSGRILAGLVQLVGGVAVLLFTYLVARLLSEVVLALHRLNDRLTVMSDDLRAGRDGGA